MQEPAGVGARFRQYAKGSYAEVVGRCVAPGIRRGIVDRALWVAPDEILENDYRCFRPVDGLLSHSVVVRPFIDLAAQCW